MNRIRSFVDYRAFMRLEFAETRKTRKSWTLGNFTRSLGLKTSSSLSKILSGQRHPGPEIIDRLIRFYGFEKRDARYFRDLVALQKLERDDPRRAEILKRVGLEKDSPVLKTLEHSKFEIVSSLLCFVVREMVNLPGFRPEVDWIRSKLRFSASRKEVAAAWDRLRRSGLVEERGLEFATVDEHLHALSDVPNEAIRVYHEGALDVAKESVRFASIDERELSATTFRMSPERTAEAKEFIRKFRSEFIERFEEREGSEVFQFQMQLFPATELGNPS